MAFTPSENPILHPTRESYTELRPFRFWCQKVLPLVYDDSLSYYELLCKVIDYLNKTMEDVDHINTDVENLYSNFQEFQEGTFKIYNELVTYVNTYFDELDVQEEINNKLDEMVTSGELVTILRPTIANEVSTWLANHITPTTPIIDDTLTISGAAADAKAVGDALSDVNDTLSESIGDLKEDLKQNGLSYEVESWTDGYRIETGAYNVGEPTASESWRYLDVPCIEGDVFYLSTVTDNFSGYRPWAFADANGNILLKGDTSVSISNTKLIAPSNAVRLVVNDHDQYNTKAWTGVCYKNERIINVIKDIYSNQDEEESKIDGLKTDLKQNGLSYGVEPWTDGYRIETGAYNVGEPTASESWRYLDVPCIEGDVFYLSTVTDNFSGYRPWAFADANGNILLKGDTSASISDTKLIAPPNAVRLVVNDHDQYNTKSWTGVCYKNERIINVIKDIYSNQDEAELKILGTTTRLGQSTTNAKMIDITSEFALTNAFISNTSGIEYADDRYRLTNYLNIYQYADLFITAYAPYGSNCFWAIYDFDKNYLGYFRGSPSEVQAITDYHFYIDDILTNYPTAMYVRFCSSIINDHELVIKHPVGLSALLLPWSDKKWVCLGDSLTESNNKTTKNYHGYVADATGIQVVNLGISGSGYKHSTVGNNAYYQRIDTVPTDADVITIFGSGNDLRHGYSLGDVTDTGTTTICGCINTTLDLLIERIPTIQLGIIAPTPWEDYNPAISNNPMEQYVNALKTICENRSIPFLDLYHCSNLRPWTEEGRETCYSKDDGGGTHPDETGHKLIAPRFKAFLNTLLL